MTLVSLDWVRNLLQFHLNFRPFHDFNITHFILISKNNGQIIKFRPRPLPLFQLIRFHSCGKCKKRNLKSFTWVGLIKLWIQVFYSNYFRPASNQQLYHGYRANHIQTFHNCLNFHEDFQPILSCMTLNHSLLHHPCYLLKPTYWHQLLPHIIYLLGSECQQYYSSKFELFGTQVYALMKSMSTAHLSILLS